MSTSTPDPETLELRAYLKPVWRRKWLVAAVTVLAAVAAYVVTSHQHKSYTASTQLYVLYASPTLDLPNPGSQGPPSQTGLANLAALITSHTTEAQVSTIVGPATLAGASVTATPSTTSSFITISVTAASPQAAATLANTFASVFEQEQAASVVSAARAQVAALRAQAKALPAGNPASSAELPAIELQISQYQQLALAPNSGLQQVTRATVPLVPSSPRPKRDAAFAAALGLLLAILLAFGLERLDGTLRTADAVEAAFHSQILTVLPHVRSAAPLGAGGEPVPPPAFLESLRSLSVVLGMRETPPRTMIVTSALAGEGKSTVTRSLALIYAQSAGKRVLVIDADLRVPGLSRLFAVTPPHGLAQVAAGELALADAIVTVAPAPPTQAQPAASSNGTGRGAAGAPLGSAAGSVDLLAHGRRLDNPLTLLTAARFADILTQAAALYDVVLVDTAPLLVVADAVPLLSAADGVLLVARLGRSTRAAGRQLRRLLGSLPDVSPLGVIANDQRERDSGGYGAYYAYMDRRYAAAATVEADPEAQTAERTA